MKVSPFKSISAKLFYYMGALVLVTVAGNSYQFLDSYLDQRRQEAQDSLQIQAEQAQEQIKDLFDNWSSLIVVALPTLQGAEGSSVAAQRLIEANNNFVALQIFTAPSAKATNLKLKSQAFTAAIEDKRFEDQLPTKVRQKIYNSGPSWLKKRLAKTSKKNNIVVESLSKSLKLPIVFMAVRYDTPTGEVIWAVLSVWQSEIVKFLPKSTFVNSAVVDAKGRVFAAHDAFDMVQHKRFRSEALVKSALSSDSPSGFQPEYRTKDDQRRLGAFAKIPRLDLTVLIEHDAEKIYNDIKKTLLPIMLWAALFVLLSVMMSYIGASRITDGLRKVTYATGRIAAGDFNFRLKPSTEDEVGALSVAVNNMSNRIVGLMQSQVEKARFEKELETAKMVQSTFFPKQDIKIGALFATGFYQPASECGGDLWGHCRMEDGLDFVFIADAMGHGAPAALVTAMAYSTTMTLADVMRDNPALRDSPAKILDRLNRIIYEAVRGTISMTFFAAIIDTRRGKITYANAGHNFPLIVPANANDERSGKQAKSLAKISDINPISLKLMGTPLGMDPTSTFKDESMGIKAGDKLFFFTDGLIECTSPEGKVWGRKFLIEQLCHTSQLGPEEMKTEVLSRAFNFFGSQPLADDVTVVVIEVDKAWQVLPEAVTPAAPIPTLVAAPARIAMPSPAAQTKPITTVTAPAAARPAAPVPAPGIRPPLPKPLPQASAATPTPAPKTPAQAPLAATKTPPTAPSPQSGVAPASSGKYKIKLPSAG